jgi:hypothetical protein
MTGRIAYTPREAAYDLRKFRGKELITKPARTRRRAPAVVFVTADDSQAVARSTSVLWTTC